MVRNKLPTTNNCFTWSSVNITPLHAINPAMLLAAHTHVLMFASTCGRSCVCKNQSKNSMMSPLCHALPVKCTYLLLFRLSLVFDICHRFGNLLVPWFLAHVLMSTEACLILASTWPKKNIYTVIPNVHIFPKKTVQT